MRKQWKPGPFLLPFSGLGTRLGGRKVTACKTSEERAVIHCTNVREEARAHTLLCRELPSTDTMREQ